MESATIALVQFRPEPGSSDKNAEKMNEYIRSAKNKNADLVVFPECSLTGYFPEKAAEFAVQADCPAAKKVEDLAAELKIAVCFGYMESVPAEEPDEPAGSRSFTITQEIFSGGTRTLYRKTHLASREEAVFKPGNAFPIAGIAGIAAGMQLCWESRIPQISAAYRKQGAQLLLFPYASGMSGEKCLENWSVHLPARASDNGCFAAACNLISHDKGGGMAVWDPKGRIIAQYWGKDENMLLCSIGGKLPREIFAEGCEDMHSISYFDKMRSELFT